MATKAKKSIIKVNPSNQKMVAGNIVTFLSDASGNPMPTVQWYKSIDNARTWSPIAGAVSNDLNVTCHDSDNNSKYKAVFTNPTGSVTTTIATLVVESIPSQENVNAFRLDFSDITMRQAGGEFKIVKRIMDNDNDGDWNSSVIKTNLVITSVFGQCMFRLDFYHDRNVTITGYASSVNDVFVNPDIRCLTRWCQANGWKVPIPIDSIIKNDLHFWKYMWSTNIIDSEYLDSKFGIRKSVDMSIMEEMSGRADNRGDDEELAS